MNHSYKYAAEAFHRILSDAGLAQGWEGTSDDGHFLMVMALAVAVAIAGSALGLRLGNWMQRIKR